MRTTITTEDIRDFITTGTGNIVLSNSPILTGTVSIEQILIPGMAGVIRGVAGILTGNSTTTHLPEGTNLYYTDARSRTSIAGTANRISYNSTTGVIDIDSAYVGQSSITTLGTVISGNWNASVISEIYGGTGISTYVLGDTIYASAANTLSRLAGNTTTNKKFLTQTGNGSISSAPIWNDLLSLDVTGALGYTPVNKAGDTMLGFLTLNANPTSPLHAATKQYVDSISAGLKFKDPVVAATIGNITLSGEQTIDGVSVVTGDRVLVKNQTNQIENGIYIVSSGAWSRSADMDMDIDIPGALTLVTGGTTQVSQQWVVTTPSPMTVGVDNVIWSLFFFLEILGGAGLTKSGSTINIGTASSSRIVINADDIDLATTGVSAGTFTKVTSDIYGRITLGEQATTTDITEGSNLYFTTTRARTSIAGTANRISYNSTTGVIDIDSAYVGQSSITTLGTITTGVWNGTVLTAIYGGTGLSSYTLGDIIYASAANTLSRLAGNTTTSKRFLTQTGNGSISAAPSWGALVLSDLPITVSGTTNTIPKFTGTNAIGNSSITDSGTLVTVASAITTTGINTLSNLAGTGNRIVIASSTGVLSASTAATFGLTSGTGTTNTLTKWTGTSTLGNSLLSETSGNVAIASGNFSVPDGSGMVSTITFARSMISRSGTTLIFGDGDGWTSGIFRITSGSYTWTIGSPFVTYLTLTTSGITVGNNTASDPGVYINGNATTSKELGFRVGGNYRWIWDVSGAESTGDAGSLIRLRARNDAGGGIDEVISIVRAAGGTMSISRPVSMAMTLAVTGIVTVGGVSGTGIIRGGFDLYLQALNSLRAIYLGDTNTKFDQVKISGNSVRILDLVSNIATFGGTVVIAGGTFQTGSSQLFSNSTNGLVITGVGSTNNFIIAEGSSGQSVIENPSGTLHTRFYGTLGIGTAPTNNYGIVISPSTLSGTSQYGIVNAPIFSASATANGIALSVKVTTTSSVFAMSSAAGIIVETPTLGPGSSVTTLYGIKIENQIISGVFASYALYTGTGAIRIGSLTGTGTRLVTVNTNGVIGASTDELTAFTTGSGTAGTIPKWATSSTLNNSIITELSNIITISGSLSVKTTIAAVPYVVVTSTDVPTTLNQTGGILELGLDIRRAQIRALTLTNFAGGETWVTHPKVGMSFYALTAGSGNVEVFRFTDTLNVIIGSSTDNGSRFQVTGTATISTTLSVGTGLVLSGTGRSSFPSNDGTGHIYYTTDISGTYPFQGNGNIVIQPRTSAARDIVFVAGNGTPTIKAAITNDGWLRLYGETWIGTDTDTRRTFISGGSGSTSGSNIVLYGSSHATDANDFILRSSSTNRIFWDNSTAILAITGAVTMSSTLAVASTLTFTSAGVAADASIWRSAGSGLSLRGITGTSYDFAVFTPLATYILRNPVGTQTVEFLGNVHTSLSGGGYWIGAPGTFTYGVFQAGSTLAFRATSATTYMTLGANASLSLALATAGTPSITVESTNSTSTSNAGYYALTSSLGGDPFINFRIAGVTNWTIGIDNSVSDNFVISASSALGSTNAISIATSTNVTIHSLSGSGTRTVVADANGLLSTISGGPISGSGTANTVPLWSTSTTLGNSIITQSGSALTISGTSTFTDTITAVAITMSGIMTHNAQAFFRSTTPGGGIIGSATNRGCAVFGPSSAQQIQIDGDDIQSMNNTTPSSLYINAFGGDIRAAINGGNLVLGEDTGGYAKLDVRVNTANAVIAAFGESATVGPNRSAYVYISNTNTINFGYNISTEASGWINYSGYLNALTQYRNFYIGDGRAGVVAYFDGSSKRVTINNSSTDDGVGQLQVNGKVRGDSFYTSGPYASNAVFTTEATGLAYAQFNDGSTVNVRLAPVANPNPWNYFRRSVHIGASSDITPIAGAMLFLRDSGSSTWIQIDKDNDTAYEGGILWASAGVNKWYTYLDNTTDNFWQIQSAAGPGGETDTAPRIRLSQTTRDIWLAGSGGQVRVGDMNAPSYTMDVSGTLRVTNNITVDYENSTFGPLTTHGISYGSFAKMLQLVSTNPIGTELMIFNNHNSTAGGSRIFLHRSRGTLTSPSTVAVGDILGAIFFQGWSGSDYSTYAHISSTVVAGNNARINITAAGGIYTGGPFIPSDLRSPYLSIGTSTTLASGNMFVSVVATCTLTLPSASANAGKTFFISKHFAGGSVTLNTTGADSILFQGSSLGSTGFSANGTAILLISDGVSKWIFFNYNQ